MKKFLVLFLISTMAVLLFACTQIKSESQTETNSATSQKSESKTDQNSQGKQKGDVTIEITPPEGWTPVEGSVLPVQYMKGTASFMVKAEPFDGETLDDVVEEALGMYQNSFDNLSVVGEAEPFTVDEKDARKLTFTCTISTMSMKYMYVYLFAADKTYVITFGDLESTFDDLADDFETILENIRFKTQ